VLRFAIPSGVLVAIAAFSSFAVARYTVLRLLLLRSRATVVMLMMSLCVVVILASPLTWRRTLLVSLVIAGFLLLFPVPSIRDFYALKLPSDVLTETLVIGSAGVAVPGGGWELSRRMNWGPAAAVKAGATARGMGRA